MGNRSTYKISLTLFKMYENLTTSSHRINIKSETFKLAVLDQPYGKGGGGVWPSKSSGICKLLGAGIAQWYSAGLRAG
jgi:hypothetical protein